MGMEPKCRLGRASPRPRDRLLVLPFQLEELRREQREARLAVSPLKVRGPWSRAWPLEQGPTTCLCHPRNPERPGDTKHAVDGSSRQRPSAQCPALKKACLYGD